MKVIRFSALVLLIGFAGLVSCNNSSAKHDAADTTAHADSVKTPIADKPAIPEYDKTFNEVSRIIAGMAVDSSSQFYKITQTVAWKNYAVNMDSNWAKLERERLTKMRDWRDTELAAFNKDSRDLFYPFSGPDFVHAYNFFPKAQNMYMFGLEGVGSLPEISKKSEKDMANYYISVQKYLQDVMNKSYFITSRMAAGLYTVNGMTPIICVFMVRDGNIVTSIEPMKISADGKMVATDPATDKKYSAVKISFLDGKTQEPKTVYYYSGDLQNTAIKDGGSIDKYLNGMPEGCNGFLKSASYLLGGENFSKVRKAMMARCSAILQDDTGIAYRYYPKDKWDITLYGVYVKPVSDFGSWAYQADLQKAYASKENPPKPLPFGIGYHWHRRQDNLIIAVKK
jgi:hypothetical protein